MKAKIISKDNNTITLLCSNNTLKVGDNVTIEEASKKTLQQLRFVHPLIKCFINSGCCSYDGDFQKIKNYLKRDIGAGFSKYYFADNNYAICEVDKLSDIPDDIRRDKTRIRGILKSMSDYTKKELQDMISNLIDMMINAGVNSKEFDEIVGEFRNV